MEHVALLETKSNPFRIHQAKIAILRPKTASLSLFESVFEWEQVVDSTYRVVSLIGFGVLENKTIKIASGCWVQACSLMRDKRKRAPGNSK